MPPAISVYDRVAMAAIRVGASAFGAAGWENAFHPAGISPAEFLTYYATQFDTVEVDSAFYRTPSAATVKGWARKAPDNFIFGLKAPRLITQETQLADCDERFENFVRTAELPGDELGPMLSHFGCFNRSAFSTGARFIARLKTILQKLPIKRQFALAFRNKNRLTVEFFDLSREIKVAYTLTDQSWMPRAGGISEKFDPTIPAFTYIRLLGDRKGIEQQTKISENVTVDDSKQLPSWVDACDRTNRLVWKRSRT